MDDWLTKARDAVAAAGGVEPGELELTEADMKTLLDLARIAAHASGDRTNAPLLAYLAGIAVARGASVDSVAAAVRDAR